MTKPILLDCTLRDGGYYNNWDFSNELIEEYLEVMRILKVDVVELGNRFLTRNGYKGAVAYCSDEFLDDISFANSYNLSVMINGQDLCNDLGWLKALEYLFPRRCCDSKVDIVRIASHHRDILNLIPALEWLANKGYRVIINLMQISNYSDADLRDVSKNLSNSPAEVLYFADSLGSLDNQSITNIIEQLRCNWSKNIGIHTHDNMGLALSNTLHAHSHGVTWLDSTVTGMGRGPGNARTEELIIEINTATQQFFNLVPLMSLINNYFFPLKQKYSWGTNPYFYLAGKYSIHPSYIQEMLSDSRYDNEDICAVIDYLRDAEKHTFSYDSLESATKFYSGTPKGRWDPSSLLANQELLILGPGPSLNRHSSAIKSYINKKKPIVMALNTVKLLEDNLIDLRIACHPVRMLADLEHYSSLHQPLITPFSMLPKHLQGGLKGNIIYDFGLGISANDFNFAQTHCLLPSPLVLAYAFAVAVSGRVKNILMAGFDGYPIGDLRNKEMENMLFCFKAKNTGLTVISVTPTTYEGLNSSSIYAM